jgi:hypothetical protein
MRGFCSEEVPFVFKGDKVQNSYMMPSSSSQKKDNVYE